MEGFGPTPSHSKGFEEDSMPFSRQVSVIQDWLGPNSIAKKQLKANKDYIIE